LRIQVRFARQASGAGLPVPVAATAGSAGLDLQAAVAGECSLAPGQRELIPTGFAISLPAGYEAQVRPRSGLALRHGILLPNSPGTIDSDYRGEIKVILMNAGSEAFAIRRGDRIAQLVVAPVVQVEWEERSSQPSRWDVPQILLDSARDTMVTQEAGDAEAGLAAADTTFEGTYYIPYISIAPMEPRAAVARWEAEPRE
jgi:dUTP pyrophosphatase